MRFRVDVDGKKVARQIGSRIESGIDDAAGDISRGIEREAQGRIRREGAIWRSHLMEGFVDTKHDFGDRTAISVRNISGHAEAQEYGVSGTQKTRDTHLSYTTTKPPIEALIPWVREHLVGSGFSPGGGGSSGPDSGGSGGSDPDGGSEVDTGSYNPLMGADDLDAGVSVSVRHPERGAMSGSINRIAGDDKTYDYQLDIDDSGTYIDVRQEWITNFDGRGADPGEVEVGQTVYVGDSNSFAVVTELVEDPVSGDVNGARVDFDNDGNWDDLLDLSQFEIVTDKDPFNLREGAILTDENGLYVPGTNFRDYDIADEIDPRTTYPGQEVVIYDTFDKKHRRAKILSYPDSNDARIEVQFDDDGGITEVGTKNASGFRFAGGRFWDSLTESEQKDHLRDHFDDNVRDGYLTQTAIMNMDGVRKPSSERLDWVRENWLDTIWDQYDDSWYVKEQFRNLQAQFGSSDIRSLQDKKIGGIVPQKDSTRIAAIFVSERQVTVADFIENEDDYLTTLSHETLHAATSTNNYGYGGRSHVWVKTLKNAEWKRDGNQATRDTDLPQRAQSQMFEDREMAISAPVGGDSWVEDAYDAAMQGSSGIHNYEPDFNTPADHRFERMLEAANHAYWMQAVAGREAHKNGFLNNENIFFTRSAYSATNAEETLATLHGVLTDEHMSLSDLKQMLARLDYHYPWLIEAWLAFFNVKGDQKDILADLGYNV